VLQENLLVFSRRLFLPVALGFRRVAARPAAFVLAGTGIALAACALAAVSAASLVVQDRAVARAIANLPPADRAVRVTWVGVGAAPADRWVALDRQVRTATERLGTQQTLAVLLYREMRLGTTLVRLGAVDGVAHAVELRSGRAPRPCQTRRCEVVSVGPGRSVPTVPGLITRGRGSLLAGPVGDFFAGAGAEGRLRLAEGVDATSRLPELGFSFRTYGWFAPIRPGDVRSWELGAFEDRVVRASTVLQARSSRFDLTAPSAALEDAGAKSRIAGRRLLLVGGEAAALLLAFVLLAGSRLRTGARATARRLEWFGAGRWQIRLSALAEAAVVAVPATLLGWLLGIVATLVLAVSTDVPAGALISRSVVSAHGAELMLAVAGGGLLVLYLGARVQTIPIGGRTISVADVAGVGALAAVLVAYAAGASDARSLASSSGTGVVLLLLPALIALVAAVALARLLVPGLRLAERFAPHRLLSLRLALLSLARAPGTTTMAVVFVGVSVGLAVFTAAYRSTLLGNEADQAAFESPLDFVVRARGAPVGDEYAARFGAVPVVRRAGEAPSLYRRGVTLLGIPAGSLPQLRWRGDFAALSRRELASRIGGPPVTPRGVALPAEARTLELPVTVRGDPVRLSVNIRTKQGGYLVVDLGEPPTGRPTLARARLPAAARGGLIVGVPVEFTSVEAFTAAHRATSTAPTLDVFRAGVLTLGIPRVRGPNGLRRLAVDYRNWVGSQGGGRAGLPAAGELRVRYLLTQQQLLRLRPRQPTDGSTVPVIASSSLARAAGANGLLPLYVGTASVNVRIAATARLFPSLSGDFVVADRSRLETALNAAVPGSALADEAWVSGGPGVAARLAQAGPVPVRVTSRRAREAELRSDPLARGALLVLASAAAAALALSLIGLALTIAVDLRDEAGELFDLETQGLGPAGLRRHLRLRALAVMLAGVAGGLAIGVALTMAVVKAIAVSANSTDPMPPLVLEPGWAVLVLALGLFVMLALAAAAFQTRAAFRGDAAVGSPEAT
jgi:ABC-type antimicrobial peptide transport system permease subunit